MEKREILAVIIAAVGICMLIGIIRMVKGEDIRDDGSSQIQTALTAPDVVSPIMTTNYWDVLHAEQSSLAAATDQQVIDPSGTDDAALSGSLITSYAVQPGETPVSGSESALANIGSVENPGLDQVLTGSLPLLTAASSTTTATSTVQTVPTTTATTTTTATPFFFEIP